MSKLYKDQGAAGGSKLLAGVALGQSQLSVIAGARFENEVLDIANIMSSKADREDREQRKVQNNNKQPVANEKVDPAKDKKAAETKETGRPEKPDD
jgi:hypothetical protein